MVFEVVRADQNQRSSGDSVCAHGFFPPFVRDNRSRPAVGRDPGRRQKAPPREHASKGSSASATGSSHWQVATSHEENRLVFSETNRKGPLFEESRRWPQTKNSRLGFVLRPLAPRRSRIPLGVSFDRPPRSDGADIEDTCDRTGGRNGPRPSGWSSTTMTRSYFGRLSTGFSSLFSTATPRAAADP